MKKRFISLFFQAALMIVTLSVAFPVGASILQQPDYNGTFILSTPDASITLLLKQDQFGNISGTLKSNNGSSFLVEGMLSQGIAAGVCSSDQGGVFFEAYLDGNDLTLSLIEPDEYNMPDYDRAQYLVFSRSTQQSNPNVQSISPLEQLTGDQNLVKHFAGEWAWSNGYRSEWLMFFPDGSFSDQYEAAYSGNTTDGWGNQTGNWSASNQSSSKGRWSIQGSTDSGVITVITSDGSQTRYEYRVFVENGEKYYREYLFNGYHYQKNKAY